MLILACFLENIGGTTNLILFIRPVNAKQRKFCFGFTGRFFIVSKK
ncbi:hypothetical protein CDIMF43_220256 [Carnobacterium divergens]|nr:hypothetical protein CDIMF43_220256 [Carnobacterium divergens]